MVNRFNHLLYLWFAKSGVFGTHVKVCKRKMSGGVGHSMSNYMAD